MSRGTPRKGDEAMAKAPTTKLAPTGRPKAVKDSAAHRTISCKVILLRPAADAGASSPTWDFVRLPKDASAELRSRGMVSIEGTIGGVPIAATLEPDGQGGHWLKVENGLRRKMKAEIGDLVPLTFTQAATEPEPEVPADLRTALSEAPDRVRDAWTDITPAARRDFIQWITSAKQEATRAKRIGTACDMLAKGKRRPCCFDRSGMYGKNLSCPVAEELPPRRVR
jgi:hypothetical protein